MSLAKLHHLCVHTGPSEQLPYIMKTMSTQQARATKQ